jgi:hypothetical protein
MNHCKEYSKVLEEIFEKYCIASYLFTSAIYRLQEIYD